MAGLTIPVTWINCSAEDIKPQMTARVVESHTDGPLVTIEGKVTNVGSQYIWFGDVVSTTVGRPNVTTTWYREPRKLPMADGSLIKLYDPAYLTDRAAIYRVEFEGSRQLTGGKWVWTDRGMRDVPEVLLEKAEILFDAAGR